MVYLAVVVTGIFSLAYVPGKLSIVEAGSSALDVMARSEALFRFGIAAEIICQTAFLILPFALCRVLWSVDRAAAILMTAFAASGVPLGFMNIAHHFEALRAIVEFKASVLTPEQADTVIASARASYLDGLKLLFVFWGLWLLPLGYLVIRSGFLLLESYTSSLLNRALSVGSFAEILFCAWIVVFGARRWVIKAGRQAAT